MYKCPHCRKRKDADKFRSYKGHPNGWCRECRTDLARRTRRAAGIREKKLSKIIGGKKLCMHCQKMLPLESFSRAKRGLGGRSAYCKICFRLRYAPKECTREKQKIWRANNSEKYRAHHRIRMFARRSNRRALSDGSVTVAVLKKIYAQKKCAYCKKPTSPKKRTVDHKTALSRQGVHGKKNLVMACKSCNSAKRDLSVKEFRKWLSKQP